MTRSTASLASALPATLPNPAATITPIIPPKAAKGIAITPPSTKPMEPPIIEPMFPPIIAETVQHWQIEESLFYFIKSTSESKRAITMEKQFEANVWKILNGAAVA